MTAGGSVEIATRQPELTEGAWLRVMPRPRSLTEGVIPAVIGSAVLIGTGAVVAGVFGVAAAEAVLIVSALVKDEAPKVWRRVRRPEQ